MPFRTRMQRARPQILFFRTRMQRGAAPVTVLFRIRMHPLPPPP